MPLDAGLALGEPARNATRFVVDARRRMEEAAGPGGSSMRPVPATLLLALSVALAACGGGGDSGTGGDGGNGAVAPASIEAPSVVGELPGIGNVLFGASYDPTTLGVEGPVTNVKQGTAPLVAVGRTLAPLDPAGVTIQIGQGGSGKKPRPIDASDKPAEAQLFAADISKDNLKPGTWIVSFLGKSGRIIASGYLVVDK
jgi:hypothetical protein